MSRASCIARLTVRRSVQSNRGLKTARLGVFGEVLTAARRASMVCRLGVLAHLDVPL